MDLKEDENSRKCFAFSSGSAIEGANEDLSLEIVEKARKREAKRKITEDLKGSDWKTVQSSKICLRCGDLGHEMSSCGNDYAPEDLKEIQCYICKSFGHLCCANIVDDGPRKVYCYNCGRLGHTGQGCTFRKRSTMASPTVCYNCFNCGKEVHLARGFTKSAKMRLRCSKICLRCGDLGHEMSSCRNVDVPEDLKENQCYICKSFGHLCCVNIVDDGPREASCYKCGRLGHTSRGCAKVRQETSSVASSICYKCGEEGHLAHGCTKSTKGHTGQGCAKVCRETSTVASLTVCYKCGGHFARHCTKSAKGCAKVCSETSTVASSTVCYKCGGGHFARRNKFAKSDCYFGETSTPSRFSKAHWNLGVRSAPHDVGKVHRKKTPPPHGKKMMTAEKSKHRSGWLTDDPGDVLKGKVKVNSWMSPTTPGRKGQAVIGHCSLNQRRRHKFLASRFNNSKGRMLYLALRGYYYSMGNLPSRIA